MMTGIDNIDQLIGRGYPEFTPGILSPGKISPENPPGF